MVYVFEGETSLPDDYSCFSKMIGKCEDAGRSRCILDATILINIVIIWSLNLYEGKGRCREKSLFRCDLPWRTQYRGKAPFLDCIPPMFGQWAELA